MQCYAAWYAHVPGLKVLTPYSAEDARGLLKAAIRDPDPVVFLENELLYVISCPTQLFSLHLSCNISKSCILLYSYGESFPIKAEVLDSSFSVPIGKAKVCSLAAGKSLVLLGILYGLPGRAYFCCLHFYC